MSSDNTYVINGISSYGIGTTIAQLAEGGLSLTTLTDNFSMNGLGFLYNGLGATWADVRQKVQDLKAVVTPPDITTLTVNNKIQVTNGTNTTTINPASITSATFTGSLNGTANFASTTVVSSDTSTITYPTFVTGTSGNQAQKINTNLTYNALSNTLTVANVTGTASTATNANNVYNSGITTAGTYGVAYMTNTVGNTAISSDVVGSHLTFNPNTNTLATRILTVSSTGTAITAPNATTINFPSANVIATTFTGALTGNATSASTATLATTATTATLATTATNATNVGITADNTSTVTYPTFVTGTSGNQNQRVDTDLTYNTSTNTLTVANVSGNASTATSATTASNLTALNPITPSYSYPVSSPSLIGWTQVITVTGRQFNTVTKAYCCNTTALVAGIYIMRPYVYCGNSSFYSGTQLINMVASNSFINNDANTGWIDPSNASPMGYLYSRIPYNTGDSINTVSWVVNNTGAGFYPYWAIAVNNSVALSPINNGVPQMNFFRVA